MGRGGRSVVTKKDDDFYRSITDEPHASRRKAILAKYPEVEKLFGNDIRVVPVVIIILISQILLAYYSKFMSWPVLILTAWIYGGAASHSLSLMTHEVSHNLVFKSPKMNELFGIFCNIGMGFPSSTVFKKYHLEHHQFQGQSDKDADIPTPWEGNLVGNSTWKKFIFLCLQFVAYGARPGYVRPKKYNSKDYFNIAVVLLSDSLLIYHSGISGAVYIFLSLALGMGLHPVAGHFIAEHYIFHEGYETYSYYGSLNWICWNVGYHNEHHDFPRIPGWRLPQLRKIAHEFYDDLPCHTSWTYVLWKFVTDPSISLFSRVVRDGVTDKGGGGVKQE